YRAGSTNTLALEAASNGAPEGSIFLAEQQTAGRGRGSNQWHSAESAGIYCSALLRPALPPSDVLTLSLAAGLAVQWAIQSIDSHVLVDLRWPKDLVVGGRKFCGILVVLIDEALSVRLGRDGVRIIVRDAKYPEA